MIKFGNNGFNKGRLNEENNKRNIKTRKKWK